MNHTEEVQTYMAKGLIKSHARDMVAKDLTLQRTRRDIEREKEKSVEAQKLSEEAQELSLFDSLTGLPNHKALFGDEKTDPPLIGKLEEVFSQSKRDNIPFTVAMIDLDFFKRYNDTYGHLVGNVALQELAKVIRRVVRHSDFVARFGGEEFTIILPHADKEQARVLIERLREEVQNMPFQGSKGAVVQGVQILENQITISAGLASYDEVSKSSISSPEDLVDLADKRMYEAKLGGRNRVVC